MAVEHATIEEGVVDVIGAGADAVGWKGAKLPERSHARDAGAVKCAGSGVIGLDGVLLDDEILALEIGIATIAANGGELGAMNNFNCIAVTVLDTSIIAILWLPVKGILVRVSAGVKTDSLLDICIK